MTKIGEHGYVRLVNNYGNELDIINAARVSFDKESEEWSDKDERLLRFLVLEQHDSVFRHCAMTFEVSAPLMVARQWWKHVVASTMLDDQTGNDPEHR